MERLPSYTRDQATYSYSARKKSFGSGNGLVTKLVLLALAGMIVAVLYLTNSAATLSKQRAELEKQLNEKQNALGVCRSQYQTKVGAYDHLEANFAVVNRQLAETKTSLQQKEVELQQKESSLQTLLQKEQAASATLHANYMHEVESLRQQILNSDNVIDALEKKIEQMEATHKVREEDWHRLANSWIQYERDLHDHAQKLMAELEKAKIEAPKQPATVDVVPQAEPKIRPESDFEHIKVDIPKHEHHRFDPLPSPSPPSNVEAPPGFHTRIRDSIATMTDKLDGTKQPEGQQQQQQQQQGDQAQQHQQEHDKHDSHGTDNTDSKDHDSPAPSYNHHHDVYHGDFDHHDDHDHYRHHYDHHYEHNHHYDPLDEAWVNDAHGDWNTDTDHGDNHHGDHWDSHDHGNDHWADNHYHDHGHWDNHNSHDWHNNNNNNNNKDSHQPAHHDDHHGNAWNDWEPNSHHDTGHHDPAGHHEDSWQHKQHQQQRGSGHGAHHAGGDHWQQQPHTARDSHGQQQHHQQQHGGSHNVHGGNAAGSGHGTGQQQQQHGSGHGSGHPGGDDHWQQQHHRQVYEEEGQQHHHEERHGRWQGRQPGKRVLGDLGHKLGI